MIISELITVYESAKSMKSHSSMRLVGALLTVHDEY